MLTFLFLPENPFALVSGFVIARGGNVWLYMEFETWDSGSNYHSSLSSSIVKGREGHFAIYGFHLGGNLLGRGGFFFL